MMLLVIIVWWTMFSGARPPPRPLREEPRSLPPESTAEAQPEANTEAILLPESKTLR